MSSPSISRVSSSTESITIAPPDMVPEIAELWRRSEFVRFSEHLRLLEEQQKFTLKKDILMVRKTESKLKQKIVELENKERELMANDQSLKRLREETMTKLKRQQEDHLSQIKILKDQHAAELKIEREKVRAEEIKRKSTEIEIGKFRNNTLNRSDSIEFERRILLLQSELEQALEREKILIRSREYFRTTVIKMATASPVQKMNDSVCLIEKRDQLLDSGMYDESDPLIQNLNLKIKQGE